MNHICLNPTIDFEQAPILSGKLILPNDIIKGFNFHFNKCIYTKLEDLGHLSTKNQVKLIE